MSPVDEYIAQFSLEQQKTLQQIRAVVKGQLPNAEECIKYGMPTYFEKENLVHFAQAKHHIGFYPGPKAIVAFENSLTAYKTSKGAIQFAANQPIPYELIKEMTAWRLQAIEK